MMPRVAAKIGRLAPWVWLFAFAPIAPAPAQPPGTEIRDILPSGFRNCTIEILGGDLVACSGDSVTVSADLTCEEGTVPVAPPQWYLGGEFLGAGETVSFLPEVGTHTLVASCGSCEDLVEVRVLEAGECHRARIDAFYSDDEIARTTGIFLPVNVASVPTEEFGHRRYLMRPFVISVADTLTTGHVTLDATGASLEVYDQSGVRVTLPASYPAGALPETLLVSGAALGTEALTASYEGGGLPPLPPDILRVRVGVFPGLAGRELPGYPHFSFVAAVNANSTLMGALDPTRHAERAVLPYRAYVVEQKSPEEWAADNTLVDVTGGYKSLTVVPGSIESNRAVLWSTGLDAGTMVGKGYDVVYDFGLNGRLDPGDLIDGLSADEAGVYIVKDLNAAGPYATTMIQYSGGTWLGQRTYFPTDIAGMGRLPLVVISHGNGHNYTWYDYLGYHLASYGYIVMSHQNNTQPGIQTASTTTLTNTDYIIGHQGTIGGGVLNGHIDNHNIAWIGHSRGGEGVVRAYDRIVDGAWTPTHYTLGDIVLVSSIAPTVYLGTVDTNPHTVNYHLLFGAADGDVNGGPALGHRQSLRIAEAAQGRVQVTYVHGAGHNDFNCCGWNDATGPALIGRTEAQRVAKSYYLALVEHYMRGNVPARDYLTRMYGDLRPSGIAPSVICSNTYRDALATDRFVIDDYQSNTGTGTSSSGGAVVFDVANLYEGRLDDGNTDLTWMSSDPMNGMTRTDSGDIYQGGAVFDWTAGQERFYEFEIVPDRRDFRDHTYLSLRACQGTRHPETVALNGPLTFSVTLRDGAGRTSTIPIGSYGAITRPYQRTGMGTGAGWANEFNTVRIRLVDFTNDGTGIDLADVEAVRLQFGSGFGSPRGRLGIDDLELTRD